jgi:outer membrane protein assembly factor BamB
MLCCSRIGGCYTAFIVKKLKLLPLLMFSVGLTAWAIDWHQWRGPERTGQSAETDLLERWPQNGPPLAWKIEGIGEGFSSFSIASGRVFTQVQRGGQQYVLALDEGSGKTVWETPNGTAFSNNRGSGPRGTPTVDGARLYALGSNGNLACLDAASGKPVWRINVLKQFGGSNISWGLSESPLIDGDRLIVNAGGAGASVVALNKNNGQVIWKSQSDEAGYSSAMVAVIGGIRQYVLLTGEAGIGVRADNGELLWRYDKVSNRTANIATPIVRGDHVFLSSDYGTGCALLKLSRQNGGVRAEEVYFNREMRNHYSSSVLVGDYLYGYSSSILTCMRFDTGEVAWRDRSVGKGQVIYADGKLYLLSEDGNVALAEANPAAYKEISRFSIGHRQYPTWTLPVIANGKLYLRDQGMVWCYNIRG